MRLRRTSRINLFIPVEFINHDKAPRAQARRHALTVRPEVELR
jgi:large subunit ribosomal protein L25